MNRHSYNLRGMVELPTRDSPSDFLNGEDLNGGDLALARDIIQGASKAEQSSLSPVETPDCAAGLRHSGVTN